MPPEARLNWGDSLYFGNPGHWGYKTVAVSRYRLHKPWVVGGIVQGFAQLPRGRVQSGVKIYKLMGPNLLTDLLAGDQFTRTLQQQCQDSKGLLLQTNTRPRFGEFAFAEIDLEGSKASKPS